jgi:hypothetical protein
MYRKDLLKEWLSGHLASYGWYLDYTIDNTLKSKCKLREKFEDAHLDKPALTESNFRGGTRSHNAKKLRKTKDQSAGPSSDKQDDKDLE